LFLSLIIFTEAASDVKENLLPSKALRCYSLKDMDRSVFSKYLAELGRKGGKARLRTMTPEQRRASARNASKAAAKARKQKAKERKAKNG
jgi:hypothetical protein